jgi:hypothetical protein
MFDLWDRPLVLVAWIVATVLIAFGVRRLSMRRDATESTFGAALVFFLLLNGVAVTGCSSRNACSPAPASVHATGDAAPRDQVSRDEPAPPPARIAQDVPPHLAQGDRWERFSTLWRELDRVEPRRPAAPGEPQPFADLPYTNALEEEAIESYRKNIDAIMGFDVSRTSFGDPARPLVEGAADADLVSLVLAQVAIARAEHMGFDRSMMTRMMPPRGVVRRRGVVHDMEMRIDDLLELSKRGAVDRAAFDAGLTKLQEDVYLWAVLSLVSSRVRAAPDETWSDPDALIRAFDEAAGAVQAGPDQALVRQHGEAIKARLVELRSVEARIDAAVAELERRD